MYPHILYMAIDPTKAATKYSGLSKLFHFILFQSLDKLLED